MSTKAVAKIFCAATSALTAAGLLTVAAPAAADPLRGPCDQQGLKYEFVPGPVILMQDNNIQVVVDTDGVDRVTTAKYFIPNQGGTTSGTATGGLNGRAIDFNTNWNNGAGAGLSNHYTGTVNDDGSANGTTVNSLGTSNSWTSQRLARCAT